MERRASGSVYDAKRRFFSRKGAKALRRNMSSQTYFASLRLCGRIFLLILACTSSIYSQTDLTNLEQSVRDQITTAEAALAALIKSPSTTQTTLSEEYGKLGELYHAYSL